MTLLRRRSGATRAIVTLATLAAVSPLLAEWLRFAIRDERYTYTLAAPLVAAGLLWAHRRDWWADTPLAISRGLPWIAAAAAAWVAGAFAGPLRMTLAGAALALAAIGTFRICYPEARSAPVVRFAAISLLLIVPPPPEAMDRIVAGLQQASSEVTYVLFRWSGMPVIRESQFVYDLPGVEIEVADECSGIRSAMSLFAASFALAHFFFRNNWLKAILVLSTFPISIFKNAVRIATLSWLGVYVDRDYLTGNLHRHGGALFALLAVALLAAFALLLRKSEQWSQIRKFRS